MLKSGLVSISFRKLKVDEIIAMVKKAHLKAIEWGSDVHVLPGDYETAAEVHEKCLQNDIVCPSYGSYYRIGTYLHPKAEFEKIIKSAEILNCQTIRVWAGTLATHEASESHWQTIIKETKMLCEMAQDAGLSVSFEFHGNTLTDNVDDTIKLMNSVNEKNLFTYWQPPVGLALEKNKEDILKLQDKISNVHVFYWRDRERLALQEGLKEWNEYFELLSNKKGYAMLEFVKEDSITQFFEDSKTLKELLNER
ncbi:MAG: TIM barrel protein [Clostridia bacterium]|nr:TIM barrel protein [Clostridia bacterium]